MRKLAISILVANILVTTIFWYTHSGALLLEGGAGLYIALGRLAGLYAELAILTQLILIGRVRFVERAYGFDKLNNLHRKVGYWIGGTVILHPLLLLTGYSMEHGVNAWVQLLDFLNNYEDVGNAVAGLALLIAIVIISLPYFRKLFKYETWHILHLPVYLVVALVFGHQVNTASVSSGRAFYYWYAINLAVFAILLFYRFLVPVIMYRRHKFVVEKLVPETPTVTSVYISGDNMSAFKYEAGQYIHVWFLRGTFMQGLWQPHPFSISKAYDGKSIRLSIKNVGDYTSTIKDLKPGTKVLIEGPFGRFTQRASSRRKFLLIAGGIGITPIRSLMEELHTSDADTILLFSARSEEELALKSELETFKGAKQYLVGPMSEERIKSAAPDYAEREIYVCGPPVMMNALVANFRAWGVQKNQIHFEKFGY